MDVTVTGRHVTLSEEAKERIKERITKVIERLKDQALRAEVEVTATEKKGAPQQAFRVEITLRGKGPVIRGTAQGETKKDAFEAALEKMKAQLRKAADRRKSHRGQRLGDLPVELPSEVDSGATSAENNLTYNVAGMEVIGEGPLVVREKEFTALPITLAQALDAMELVGHDFFLFQDSLSGLPSVVYRRRAYDYGVIRLNVQKN